MFDQDDDSDISVRLKPEEPPKRRRPKKIKMPRRALSVDIPEPRKMVMTAGLKREPVKLRPCLMTPRTLYELCAEVLDKLTYPEAFEWSEEQVADWMADVVGLPQYRACITDNHINGRRLLRLEDPSVLPEINIHYFEHIKIITAAIRKLFSTDFARFARSIGLPLRNPITHCTWFKSKTGPSWGIRQDWTRSDILRWMKILKAKPLYLDHWDLVWYQKPEFPKVMFARIPMAEKEPIPIYKPVEEYCNEYTTPRRFRLLTNIPEEAQLIWMEHLPGSPSRQPKKKDIKKDIKKKVKPEMGSRLMPKKVILTGLVGKDLILARRKMPTPKFLRN